ncbi:hypothetical protein J1N35_040765 [Gossypium stocksii]|uniref:Uncharacterized protein n=1 Tax=Gossypium stocksii TaxID=47602 RepID=A0A9D3UEK8_9ROSI|nr:hypothetical protein J1N35_040765 [Gossypium stocksii]
MAKVVTPNKGEITRAIFVAAFQHHKASPAMQIPTATSLNSHESWEELDQPTTSSDSAKEEATRKEKDAEDELEKFIFKDPGEEG